MPGAEKGDGTHYSALDQYPVSQTHPERWTGLAYVYLKILNEAITKNQTAIQKTYASEQRREEDTEKMGIQGSLYITLQQELIKSCPIYALFEKEIQTFREASKAGASMQKKNGGSK